MNTPEEDLLKVLQERSGPPAPHTDLEKLLAQTLSRALSHLEYCGFGRDAWERDCAGTLPRDIDSVIRLTDHILLPEIPKHVLTESGAYEEPEWYRENITCECGRVLGSKQALRFHQANSEKCKRKRAELRGEFHVSPDRKFVKVKSTFLTRLKTKKLSAPHGS